jgi:hypothetical protein
MTDIQAMRNDAINTAKIAVEHDDKGNVEEACKNYIKAAEKLKFLSSLDENTYTKETYRNKAIEYCERAAKLKGMISQQEEKKQPVISGGGK